MKLLIFLLISSLSLLTHAGFWDDFVSTISEKANAGAEFLHKEALPAISSKFHEVKTSIQESEVPEKIHAWAKDEAAPKISEGWESLKNFVNAEVAPKVKKVYNAAVEGPNYD